MKVITSIIFATVLLTILLSCSVYATDFVYNNPISPRIVSDQPLCANICTNINVSSIFNETDPVQPWTNDTSQIFPKTNFPHQVKTTTGQTQTGFLVDGTVTDGFVCQGSADPDAVVNSFCFSVQSVFNASNNGKEYWGLSSAPFITGNANQSAMRGVYSTPFQRNAFGVYNGTLDNLSMYDAGEGLWQSGTINNVYYFRGLKYIKTGGTWKNVYGLYVPNVTEGSTSNYAIYTNLGSVHFGDNVTAPNLCLSNGTNCQSSSGNPFDQNLNTTANVTHAQVNITGKGVSNGENALTVGNCLVTSGSGIKGCFETGIQINGSDDSNDIIDTGIFSQFVINAHEFRFFNKSDATPTGFLGQSFGEAQESCGNFACESKALYVYISNAVSELRYYDYLLRFIGTAGTKSRIEGVSGGASGTNKAAGNLTLAAGNGTGTATGFVNIEAVQGITSGTGNVTSQLVGTFGVNTTYLYSQMILRNYSDTMYAEFNGTGGQALGNTFATAPGMSIPNVTQSSPYVSHPDNVNFTILRNATYDIHYSETSVSDAASAGIFSHECRLYRNANALHGSYGTGTLDAGTANLPDTVSGERAILLTAFDNISLRCIVGDPLLVATYSQYSGGTSISIRYLKEP